LAAASKALDKPPDADRRAVAIDPAAVIAVSGVGPVIVAGAELVRLALVAAAGGPGHWSLPARAPTPGRLPALCVLSSQSSTLVPVVRCFLRSHARTLLLRMPVLGIRVGRDDALVAARPVSARLGSDAIPVAALGADP
jgi:hypothetical protein